MTLICSRLRWVSSKVQNLLRNCTTQCRWIFPRGDFQQARPSDPQNLATTLLIKIYAIIALSSHHKTSYGKKQSKTSLKYWCLRSPSTGTWTTRIVKKCAWSIASLEYWNNMSVKCRRYSICLRCSKRSYIFHSCSHLHSSFRSRTTCIASFLSLTTLKSSKRFARTLALQTSKLTSPKDSVQRIAFRKFWLKNLSASTLVAMVWRTLNNSA